MHQYEFVHIARAWCSIRWEILCTK